MKNLLFTLLFCLLSVSTFGQITSDSTAQVVGYWAKGNEISYKVSDYKIKIVDGDTVNTELITYDVDITILKADKKGFTIQWHHKNIETNNPNPTIYKLLLVTNELKVQFRTDEFGAFVEVLNWKEIKNYTLKKVDELRKEFKDMPEMALVLNNIEKIYMTKEAIEAVVIKDIRQFLTFHGTVYTLGEQNSTLVEVFHLYSAQPFEAESIVELKEINAKEENFLLGQYCAVDEAQLQDAAYTFFSTVAKQMKKTLPKKEEFINMRKEFSTTSAMHSSGWPLWSFGKSINSALSITHIEEFRIELK